MNAKSTIRKVLFVALWLCIGGGMVTLLLAAITRKKNGQCNDYTISIKGKNSNYFIDEKDVQQLLMKATSGSIKGQPVASFELYQLEQMLEHNTWINDAELYFDNQDVLHVTVTEKIPVARIFTAAGESFYIDSLGKKMPLSEKLSARVPVFTNFPDKKVLSVSDSLLLNNVKTTAIFIVNDSFWMAQVAQVDINEDRTFDMIPVVGNHTVKLGDGNHIDQKFHRLMVFYKQVLSKTGFDTYKSIDVQYKGQIVVSKQLGNIKVDSVQLRKNVEKLLRQARESENDTTVKTMTVTGKYVLEADSITTDDFNKPDDNIKRNNPDPITNPNPLKTISLYNSKNEKEKVVAAPLVEKKKTDKPELTKKKKEPKAVMPKKLIEVTNSEYN